MGVFCRFELKEFKLVLFGLYIILRIFKFVQLGILWKIENFWEWEKLIDF